MSSDVEEEVGGEEEEDVIAAPDDTYADDDFNGAVGAPADDDELAQGGESYAADDDDKEDPEPELEPEPSKKTATRLEEEPSYQDDFEQSLVPGASRMPEEEEDCDATSAAIDEPVDDDDVGTTKNAAGAIMLTKSSSGTSRTSSGSRPGSAKAAAAPPKPAPKAHVAASASKPAAAPKPAAAASPVLKTSGSAAKPAAPAPTKPLPVPLKPVVSKPAPPPPKPAVLPAPKPAVPRPSAPPPAVKPVPPKPAAPVAPVKPTVPARNMASTAPPPAQPAPTGVGSGGQKVKLTFTGPPNTQRAAPTVKPDYSHSNYEVKKINSDNVKLCNRLVEISRAPPNPAYNNALSVGSAAVTGKLAPANVAAATVNRHRKEDKIAQENLALYKRLQSVKPSPSVNRDILSKDFVKTQAYGDNARKVKSPPHANPATGLSASKVAASGVARQPAPGSAEEVYSRPSGSGSVAEGSRGMPDRAANGEGGLTAAPDLSTVLEGPEGEVSDGTFAAAVAAAPPSATGDLEPEYSIDPEFDQAPSQSFAA